MDYTAGQNVVAEPDENTLRVMLSTDNHLGYEELDSVRGNDSFAAFEEVLYLAKRFQCDMVLIAGDLFHENRPTRQTLYRTMEIIRRYTMGPDPVRIEILSDPSKNFRTVSGKVNYQEECYSVDLPIFSIHGNHDDPTREGTDLLAALDLLAVSNLVNYFGRQEDIKNVNISPVLLQKGTTRVAMYGLGSMRDARLNRMWREGKVNFFRPTEDTQSQRGSRGRRQEDLSDDEDPEEGDDDEGFFNIFTLHQNRDAGRGKKNCVEERMIPEWMDLCVWGHEHECQIEFAESVVGTFRISQPGSSVATSLVAGEEVTKKVGILDIKGKIFRLHPVPLTQVRTFITGEICLREHRSNLDSSENEIDKKITRVLTQEVSRLHVHARDKREATLDAARAAGNNVPDLVGGHESDEDNEASAPGLLYKLARSDQYLVRLRVEHSEFDTLNNQRFGQQFLDRVANSDNILLFHRKKGIATTAAEKAARAALKQPIEPQDLEQVDMNDLIDENLVGPKQHLKLLGQSNLGEALETYVEKSISASIPETAEEQLHKKQKFIVGKKDVGLHSNEIFEVVDETKSSPQQQDEQAEKPESSPTPRAGKKRGSSKKESENVVNFSQDKTIDGLDSSLEDDSTQGRSSQKSSQWTSRKSSTEKGRRKTARRGRVLDEDSDDGEKMEVDPTPRSRSRRSTQKKVNYSLGDDDDDDDSDAVIEIDDDDDDLEADEEPPKKPKSRSASSRKKSVSSSRSRSSAATTTRKKPATSSRSKKKKTGYSDSEDENPTRGGSESDEEPWGTAATSSQAPP